MDSDDGALEERRAPGSCDSCVKTLMTRMHTWYLVTQQILVTQHKQVQRPMLPQILWAELRSNIHRLRSGFCLVLPPPRSPTSDGQLVQGKQPNRPGSMGGSLSRGR
ncbi:MAG: hypothetical protein WDW38_005577 [Sanguina aurantia]